MIQPLIQFKIRYDLYYSFIENYLQDKSKLITINLENIPKKQFTVKDVL